MRTSTSEATAIRIALSIIAILFDIQLLSELKFLLVLIVIAAVVATEINTVVKWIHTLLLPPGGWQISRWLDILFSFLSIGFMALGLFFFVGSAIWNERSDLWSHFSTYMDTGVTLCGLLGALVSIPVAAALRVYLRRIVIPAIQSK